MIIALGSLYVSEFNNAHFEVIKSVNFNNLNQWSHGKRIEVTESNDVIKITSNNSEYASWPLLNSKGINVYSGETILLSVFAIYVNTAQSSLRIIGNMTQGESVIGYAFIVDGNSSWQNYSVKITVPNNVSSAFLQLSIG